MKENFEAELPGSTEEYEPKVGDLVKRKSGETAVVTEIVNPHTIRVKYDDGKSYLDNPTVWKPVKKGGIIVDVDFKQKRTGTD